MTGDILVIVLVMLICVWTSIIILDAVRAEMLAEKYCANINKTRDTVTSYRGGFLGKVYVDTTCKNLPKPLNESDWDIVG